MHRVALRSDDDHRGWRRALNGDPNHLSVWPERPQAPERLREDEPGRLPDWASHS